MATLTLKSLLCFLMVITAWSAPLDPPDESCILPDPPLTREDIYYYLDCHLAEDLLPSSMNEWNAALADAEWSGTGSFDNYDDAEVDEYSELAKRVKRSAKQKRPSLEEMLEMYRRWRMKNGYGRTVARWGRSVPSQDSEVKQGSRSMTRARTKRSSKLSPEALKSLLYYAKWRKENGYGRSARRWG